MREKPPRRERESERVSVNIFAAKIRFPSKLFGDVGRTGGRWVGEGEGDWVELREKTWVVKESAKNPPNLQQPNSFLRAKHITTYE